MYGMNIDEIINNIFYFQHNILQLKVLVYSDTFIKKKGLLKVWRQKVEVLHTSIAIKDRL